MLHKIHVSEVERDTNTQRVTQTEKNQGYYMQGDEKMDSNCNHPEEGKYSLKNKKVTSFDKIPFSQKIPSSQKMTAIQNMPDREQNRPPLNFNDTKITAKENIIANKHNGRKWTFYNTSEELMVTPIFINNGEWYHGPTFYRSLGILKDNYKFTRYLFKRKKTN